MLLFLLMLHCLLYAAECSYAARNMDTYLERAYYGTCTDFYEFDGAWGRRSVPCYAFQLNGRKVVSRSVWFLENAGFNADRFEQLVGDPMRFAYTHVPRPFTFRRMLLGIEYQGTELFSTERIADVTKDDARDFYILAAIFAVFPLTFWSVKLTKRIRIALSKQRKQRKKLERRAHYQAKLAQTSADKINSSKGDKT